MNVTKKEFLAGLEHEKRRRSTEQKFSQKEFFEYANESYTRYLKSKVRRGKYIGT